jgi:hypothetical protein
MDLKTLKACILAIRPERAVLLKGESGIGKSAFIREEITPAANLSRFTDVRLGQMTEGDVRGLPEKTTEGTVDILPEWFMSACKEPTMLFFDELNRAMPTVLQAVFQIILDRKLSCHTLHPQTRVVAAINVGRKYDVTTLDPALLRRFAQFEFTPSVDEWLGRAQGFGVPRTVVDFLTMNPGHLETAEPLPDDRIGPSRRSWTFVGQDLTALLAQDNQHSLVYPITRSMVGDEAATAFVKFLSTQKKELMPDDFLKAKSTEKFPEMLETLSHEDRIRLADLVTKDIVQHGIKRSKRKENFAAFVDLLPDELVASTWRMISNSEQEEKGAIGNAIIATLTRVL